MKYIELPLSSHYVITYIKNDWNHIQGCVSRLDQRERMRKQARPLGRGQGPSWLIDWWVHAIKAVWSRFNAVSDRIYFLKRVWRICASVVGTESHRFKSCHLYAVPTEHHHVTPHFLQSDGGLISRAPHHMNSEWLRPYRVLTIWIVSPLTGPNGSSFMAWKCGFFCSLLSSTS